MSDQLPHIICNGELEIVKITEDLYDEAVKLVEDDLLPLKTCANAYLPLPWNQNGVLVKLELLFQTAEEAINKAKVIIRCIVERISVIPCQIWFGDNKNKKISRTKNDTEDGTTPKPLFTDNFMQNENICIAVRLLSSPLAVKELQAVCSGMLKENISFAARNIGNGELAAIAVNHLMSQAQNAILGEDMNSFQSREMRCICDYLLHIETSADIYNAMQVDCVMEIVFLATGANYQQRGLASILAEYSIGYARRLLKGTLSPEYLPAAHVRTFKPSAVCSVFTSLFTQRIGSRFDFQILTKLPFTDLAFEGETFAERIDPIHECTTFEALRL